MERYGRPPANYKEIAEFDPMLGLTETQYTNLMQVIAEVSQAPVSLDAKFGMEEDEERYAVVSGGGESQMERDIERTDRLNTLDIAIKKMLERNESNRT